MTGNVLCSTDLFVFAGGTTEWRRDVIESVSSRLIEIDDGDDDSNGKTKAHKGKSDRRQATLAATWALKSMIAAFGTKALGFVGACLVPLWHLSQNVRSPLNPNDHLYSQRKAFHSPQSGARLPSSFLTAISPWIKAVAALRCSIRRPHCPSPSLPTKAHRQRQRTQKPKPLAPLLRIPFSYSSLSLASKPFSSTSRPPLRTPFDAFAYDIMFSQPSIHRSITLPIHHNVLQHALHHRLPRLHALPHQSPEGRGLLPSRLPALCRPQPRQLPPLRTRPRQLPHQATVSTIPRSYVSSTCS